MGPVEEALDAELRGMGAVGSSALAASARRLAQALDTKFHALVATEFRQTLAALREQAPAKTGDTPADELKKRRAARRRSA